MSRPILLAALAASLPAFAADRHVDPAGSDDTNDCTDANTPCATLGHAAGEAEPGDVLRLAAGSYSSGAYYPIDLPDSVGIVGAGASTTKVTGDPGTVVVNTYRIGLRKAEAETTFEGFSIEGTGTGVGHDGLRFDADATDDLNLVLRNLGVTDVSEKGIRIEGSSGVATIAVDGVVASNNGDVGLSFSWEEPASTLTVTSSTMSGNGDDGIYYFVDGSTYAVWGAGTAIEHRATFEGNTLTDNGDDGIELAISDYLTADVGVRGNTITGNDSNNVEVYVSDTSRADVLIEDNTIADAGEWGIEQSAYGYNTIRTTIRNNDITGGASGGVRVVVSDYSNTVDLLVEGNTITESDGDGMRIGITDSTYNAFFAEIRNNTITGHGDDGVDIRNTYSDSNNLDVFLTANVIAGNDDDGIVIDNSYGAFTGLFRGNLIVDNVGDGIDILDAGASGFWLDLVANVIRDNADGYTVPDTYDVDGSNLGPYDIFALDNWWGTTDRTAIGVHILDSADEAGGGQADGEVRFTALDSTLAFTVQAAEGPEAGGNVVALTTTDGTPPFVPTVGDDAFPLLVTFGTADATVLSVSEDGTQAFVVAPAGSGTVDVSVTNPGDSASGTATGAYTYLAAPQQDTGDPGGDDTGDPGDDTGSPGDDTGGPDDGDDKADGEGCGCNAAPTPGTGAWILVGLLGLGLRRRR